MNKDIQRSILSIKLNQEKGIQLNWNFKGSLKNDIYFRHLLISQANNSQFFYEFAQMYFSRIKNGDLFCIKTPCDFYQNQKPKFVQKTSLKKYQKIKRKQNKNKNQSLNQILNQIAEYSTSYSQPMIISIVYDSEPNLSKIKPIINEYRKLSLFDFIFNIFGHIDNNINFGDGIHTFSTQQNNLDRSLNFLKWYISNLSMIKAEVEIRSQNGQINVQSKNNWIQSDFYNIKKKYYGLTNHQLIEQLFFYQMNGIGTNIYKLNVKITYETLNKKIFYDYKSFDIDCQKYRANMRTCNHHQLQHYYEVIKDFYVVNNPFESDFYVFFTKQPEDEQRTFF